MDIADSSVEEETRIRGFRWRQLGQLRLKFGAGEHVVTQDNFAEFAVEK